MTIRLNPTSGIPPLKTPDRRRANRDFFLASLSENERLRRNLIRSLLIFSLLLAGGTAGYTIIENWRPFDAFYMTITTLATVGYGEIHPLSDSGRAFSAGLIILGVGNVAYAFGTVTQFFASGGWDAYWRRARLESKLHTLSGHTIICGYGRLGTTIAHVLRNHGAEIVVVERNPSVITRLTAQEEIPFVAGEATEDETLLLAGIRQAKTLVAALNDDSANVFLTLTARVLNPAITVYGKADDPNTLVKLERAGANHIFSPSLVAGNRVAMQIVRPAITDLVEIASGMGNEELAIEEIAAEKVRGCAGQKLEKTPFWGQKDFLVVAVRNASRQVIFRPQGDYLLDGADRVIIMGHPDAISKALGGAA